MRGQRVNKRELQDFQKNRKKLNNMISQVFGPEIHLHQISEDSEVSSSQDYYPIGSLPKSSSNIYSSSKTQVIRQQKSPISQSIEYSDNKKAHLWSSVKNFIQIKLANEIKMNSVETKADDEQILSEFLLILKKLIEGAKETIKKGNHAQCQRKLAESIQNLQQQKIHNHSLQEKVKMLTEQNNILRKLKQNYKGQEKQMKEQISMIINNMRKKTEENDNLRSIIHKLQQEIAKKSLYNNNSQKVETLQRTITLKNQEIVRLHMELRGLKVQLTDEKVLNRKMKKIIRLAKQMNDDFGEKFQSSFSNNPPMVNILTSSQYFPNLMKKQTENRPFHLANKRLGIVKSRSLVKDYSARKMQEKRQIR